MNPRRKHHFLKKMMYRELYGEIRECRSQSCERLFYQLPHRLAFSLSHIAPGSALSAGHVFLGFTKCGQFILSYTHSCDTDDHTLQIVHRYRLHWWLFTPYSPLRKVAEVMLFGDQDLQESIYENIYISVCQWPKDLSKILVYGCSLDGGDGGTGPQTRRVYITITAVPSLDNCSACYQVATSYEEDDLAERWNTCVRFSCLQHGITVHTSFEMVPPFPRFMPTVQMKMEGHVVLNAGNFIHVLSVSLENLGKKTREATSGEGYTVPHPKEVVPSAEESEDDDQDNSKTLCEDEGSSSDNEQAVNSLRRPVMKDDCSNNLRISLRDQHTSTDKDREWEILIGNVPNSQSEGSASDKKPLVGCALSYQSYSVNKHSIQDCDIKSTDSDCSSISGDVGGKVGLFSDYHLPDGSPFLSVCDDFYGADSDDSTICSRSADESYSTPSKEKQQQPSEILLKPNVNSYVFPDSAVKSSGAGCGSQNGLTPCSRDSPPTTPSKQAEKEYEFIDEIKEARHEKLSVFRRRRLAEKKYEFSDENSENIPQNYRSFRSQSRRLILSPSRSPRFRPFSVPLSELSVELGETSGLFRSVYEKLLSPSSGSASPNDVLRPINQNITSPVLSPRDDKWREDIDRIEKAEMQRWSSRESLALYSPVSYAQKTQDYQLVSQQSSLAHGPQTLKCVVDIKRRYIEIDDELVSIITDIEDDELSSATGYHNALSLEVHGSGYSQMHMISNSKAEKLMVPGVLVRQVSLDVEQFCHETAQRLCNEAGKKYYFCNDYNVEIVDVCPSSHNVIALASVLVQAGNSKTKASLSKSFRGRVGPPQAVTSRRLYKATATFVFNVDTKTYYLLDKEPLVEEDPYNLELDSESVLSADGCEEQWWQRARITARQLRYQWAVPTDYFSSIKAMTNESLLKGESLTHIMEGYHLVALVMMGNNSY